MTEITQADRDAAEPLSGCGFCPDGMADFAAEILARHRIAAHAEGYAAAKAQAVGVAKGETGEAWSRDVIRFADRIATMEPGGMTGREEVANSRKYLTKPRPFPVMMDYNGLVQALREEWNALDPIDESRPLIWEAVRAIETLCGDIEEREEYLRRMYASLVELVDGIEGIGGDKWIPHRVERAVHILTELRSHDGK